VRRALIAAMVSVLCATADPASGNYAQQWALSYLHADQVWRVSRGAGVTIAVIDTGVQPNADLPLNLLAGGDFSDGSGRSAGDGRTDSDSAGHGTGMAVLIGGSGVASHGMGTLGLASATKILPVRASDGGASGFAFGVAPAIGYAVAHGARIINMSFGGAVDDPAIHTAIQSALDHDIVVVAAVGNDATGAPRYPAAYPGVLGVGAIDSTGAVWAKSNYGADVSLVAPGVHIYRDDNQGRQGYSDGTSEATAYVSAAAALVRSAHPAWTAAQVVSALTSTADKPAAMHGAVRDDHYGYGILDVLAAVKLGAPPDGASSAARAAPATSVPAGGVGTVSGGSRSVGPTTQDARQTTGDPASNSNSATATLVAGAALAVAVLGVVGYSMRRGRRRTR
jgi:hypothetical protein